MNKASKIVTKIPMYKPEKWKQTINAGCYTYVLNLFEDKFYLIGDFIGKRCKETVSDEKLIEVFIEEISEHFNCEIEEVDSNKQLEKGKLKVYIQRHIHTGYYHFFRQDSNGFWSHKYPRELPTKVDSVGEVIENPDEMVDMPFVGWCFEISQRN